MHIDYKGYKIAYQDVGHGHQTLLFIHGLPLASQSWQCQVDYFKDQNRVITVDLPGYGKSSPLLDYMMKGLSAFYAEAIEAVLTELKVNKVVYIGFATGGHVGMLMASKYQHLIDKLVLMNTSPQFIASKDWPYGFDQQAIDYFNHAFETQSLLDSAKALLEPSMQEKDSDQLIDIKKRFAEMAHDCGKNTLKAFFNNISLDNYRPYLPTIKAKTLIIQSSLDREVRPEVALYMRQQIQDSQLVEIHGADHFVFATRKDLVNELINNFINPSNQICQYDKND